MEFSEVLQFSGCNFMRERLVFSLLSARPVHIAAIRALDSEPGVRDFEMKLFSLLEKVTNGTHLRINDTGTEIVFTPGMITGGSVTLNCGSDRCLSYYLEPLMILAPFCKKPLKVILNGVTNTPNELSVDAIRTCWLPVFNKFVFASDSPEIKIEARGMKPNGEGKVVFSSPITRVLRPVKCDDCGKICKIRGVAYVMKVTPSFAHRMITSAKNALRNYIADVYITVDQRKGLSGGGSPGFGLFLTAETTEGIIYHAESVSKAPDESGDPSVPEDTGREAAYRLLDQIYAGGCLDTSAQALAATYMTLGEKDVSSFLFGPLSSYCVYTLRNLQRFFGTVFKIDNLENSKLNDKEELKTGNRQKALMTCIGVGYSNLNKTIL